MVSSLADKKRGLKIMGGERIDSRVALYLTRSQRITLELLAEDRGIGLNKLLRELIDAGRRATEGTDG